MAISHRQKQWLAAYLGPARFNATEAARIAGYKDPEQAGYENKRKQEIRAAIERRLDATAMSAEEVLSRLADQARGIGDYLSYAVLDTVYGPMRMMDLDWEALKRDGKLHLVKGWEYDKKGSLSILFTDPQAALVQLGRHHKLFTDRMEQVDPDLDARIERELAKLEAAREAEAAGKASGEEPEP
ncbi:MAG: hypothetical protein A2W00_04670 [Candidatus Eisenbacteria bacterium RBG_16_71_46]|nr:MAG: hypothetical protein A2W00_04670 [Candidatus Eisenbacteria bacterium RBG_16_71_46]